MEIIQTFDYIIWRIFSYTVEMVSEYLCVLVSMLICSAMLLIEVETCIQKTAHDLGKN